jgi:hypothetical protein
MPTLSLPRIAAQDRNGSVRFAALALGLATFFALLTAWAPLGFAIVTVFLFAGPHNWIEARYFLSRLPSRLGKLRGYFVLAFAGVLGLTLALSALAVITATVGLDRTTWLWVMACWDTILVGWVWTLMRWRSRQHPRRDWAWATPVALLLIALAWLNPAAWSLALVYGHPLLALWILDRELRRSRPSWRPAYHTCLAALPIFLVWFIWQLGGEPLPGSDMLTDGIADQVGAGIIPLSPRLLIAWHAYLQMLHYGVWLLAIPLVGLKSAPWRTAAVPLATRSLGWRRAVVALFAVGGVAVLALWIGFIADYPTTRDVYFTAAMVHVLAEVPFLLRAL